MWRTISSFGETRTSVVACYTYPALATRRIAAWVLATWNILGAMLELMLEKRKVYGRMEGV
jgi:L-rhamnose isomerase